MKAYGVFEGGGAKGFAHIGALGAAEARDVEFAGVAGTSIGAVVAALIAAGYRADELYSTVGNLHSGLFCGDPVEFLLDQTDLAIWDAFTLRVARVVAGDGSPSKRSRLKSKLHPALALIAAPVRLLPWISLWAKFHLVAFQHRKFLRKMWSGYGIVSTAPLRDWLDGALRRKLGTSRGRPVAFGDLRIPLRVVATDVTAGELQVFGGEGHDELSVADAVVASAAFPFFFEPPLVLGERHVDGGLLSNLPAWVFDSERLAGAGPIPTFGFRLMDPPLPASGPPSLQAEEPSFPSFVAKLVNASVAGAKGLETRGIDDYYVFELTTPIDPLAFRQVRERAQEIVEQGRSAADAFFDRALGPRDPERMKAVLLVVSRFFKQMIEERLAGTSQARACLVLPNGNDLAKVTYSSHTDSDDRVRLWRSSMGPGACLELREPVVTSVSLLPEPVLTHPLFKFEHALRPKQVRTVYSVPIFADSSDWELPVGQRKTPIGVLVLDTDGGSEAAFDIPLVQDQLATYAQLVGEYLVNGSLLPGRRRTLPTISAQVPGAREILSPGFWVSKRKERTVASDDNLDALSKRIEARLLSL